MESQKVAFMTTQENNGTLYMWDALSNQIVTVGGDLGDITINSGVYYDGGFWFIPNGTNDLFKVAIDLTDRENPFFTGADVTTYADINGSSGTYTFGDLAVTNDGILYGTNTSGTLRVFSLDISATGSGGNPTDYVDNVGSISESLQIAYNPVDDSIFAVTTNGSDWSTMNPADASLTPWLNGGDQFSGPVNGFTRDTTSIVITLPEPSSASLMLMSGLGLAMLRRRRRG